MVSQSSKSGAFGRSQIYELQIMGGPLDEPLKQA